MSRKSIKQKILLPYCAIILTVTVALGIISHQVLMTTVTDWERETLALLAQSTGEKISHKLQRRQELVKTLALSDATERYARNYAFYSLGRKFAEHKRTFPFLTYVNERGVEEERMESGRVSENFKDISATTIFRRAAAKPNEALVSAVEIQPGGEPYVSFAYWHQDFFGQFAGMIRAASPLAELIAPAYEAHVGQLGFITVIDSHGKVLSYPDKNRMLNAASGDDDPSRNLLVDATGGRTGFGRASILGVDGYIAYAPVPGTDWSLLVTLPYDEFVEAPNRLRNMIIGITLATLLALIATALFLSRTFTIPLRKLLVVTEAITKGDFSERANVRSRDEFQVLADAFNTMIDERHLAEATLREARDEAEKAAQAKAEFLAKMSHEIRTPMNGVVGMTDYLLKTGLESQQLECAQMIKSSSDHLLRVVNDILDFSRLDSGKIEISETDFDLRGLVEHSAAFFSNEAAQKGVELVSVIEGDSLQALRGDGRRLKQVLYNLVGNAVKFTHSGEIAIHAKVDRLSDGGKLCVEVCDTGIGIRGKDVDRIFDSFSQADSSTTREYGGTGLGLAISRQLIELMGGEIHVNSTLDKGSTFGFSVPVEAEFDQVHFPARSSELQGQRVLIVEDNMTVQNALRDYMNAWGMQPICVASSSLAMNVLRNQDIAGGAFDLVLVDRTLPGMDGIALARQICTRIGSSKPRILLMLSDLLGSEPDNLRELGIDATLRKPISQRDLYHALRDMLVREPVAGGDMKLKSVPTPSMPTFGASVLVVEDNIMNQRVARRMLEMFDCDVEVAENGQVALDKFRARDFDLVFMDCHMPIMDGFESCRRIRDHESSIASGKRVPIIALTASVLSDGEKHCREAGMNGFLSKPYDVRDLRKTLEQWLGPNAGGVSTAA
jgi:signal transduction histidine kinase/CheY-like chemotaxis protein